MYHQIWISLSSFYQLENSQVREFLNKKMNSFALGNYETNNRLSTYSNILTQEPNAGFNYQQSLVQFEADINTPNYDNTFEENLIQDIRDMPTKNQNIITTQVANVEADNAPYINTDPLLSKDMFQQPYDKPWGGDKQIKLQDPNDNYGGGDEKIQMNIQSQEEQLLGTLNKAKILHQAAVQRQQTEVRPVNLDWANAEDPEYGQKKRIFKNSINDYINNMQYINYMNNPNNKDSAIKKERSELYAVKPIATNAVVRTPAILMEIKNQRVNLFDNRTDLILPGKVQVFQGQGDLRLIDKQGTALNFNRNTQAQLIGFTTPQSFMYSQTQMPQLE